MIEQAALLRREMVAGLVLRGELLPAWVPAMEAVARHWFVPETVWRHDPDLTGHDHVPVHRADDPAGWLTRAYANEPVFTQVDDGAVDVDGRGREVTSSASQPAVVAQMLTALDVEPGMRVLEIGTGTGWNAALLAHRLGAGNVVTVEVDAALADQARTRLRCAGYGAIATIISDGVAEATARGPYDRLIATVGVRQVPASWMAQVRPGGTALVPWGTDWYPSALLRLDVTDEGRACGRIIGDACFMLLRDQRTPRLALTTAMRSRGDIATSTTNVHPWYVMAEPNAATAIGFRLPGVAQFYTPDGPDGPQLSIVSRDGQSWACVRFTAATRFPVEQAGPRRLWDEVVAAYEWWQGRGAPERGEWLIRVGPYGQRIELLSS